jgi:hypothetical protein
MVALLIFRVPEAAKALSLVLQGGAVGALVGSLVLCRARLRGLRVQAWSVTAAWSTLGATVAVVYLLASLVG